MQVSYTSFLHEGLLSPAEEEIVSREAPFAVRLAPTPRYKTQRKQKTTPMCYLTRRVARHPSSGAAGLLPPSAANGGVQECPSMGGGDMGGVCEECVWWWCLTVC